VKRKTPVTTPIATGVEIRATEAAQTVQVHYPAFGCAIQGDSRDDMPQLQSGHGEGR
jgi:hypothetical protein